MQVASGDPPPAVLKRDLEPDISYEEAHESLAKTITSFMHIQGDGINNGSYLEFMKEQVSATASFSLPMIKAFQMEGFYLWENLCPNSRKEKEKEEKDLLSSNNCMVGSPWTSQYARFTFSPYLR